MANSKASRSTSLFRSFTAARAVLRKQLWTWPVIAAVILSAIGLTIRLVVE